MRGSRGEGRECEGRGEVAGESRAREVELKKGAVSVVVVVGGGGGGVFLK